MSSELFYDEEIDPDTIAEGGFERIMPGKYHVQLAKYILNDKGSHEFTFAALAGKPNNPKEEDQRGRQVKLYVTQEFKPMPRKYLGQLALVLGLVTLEQARKAREEKQGISINWEDAVGRHCGAIITEEEYNGEMRARIQWPDRLFSLSDDQAKGMPIDKASIDSTDDPFSGAAAGSSPGDTPSGNQGAAGKSGGAMFD